MVLFAHFFGSVGEDHVADAIADELRKTLDKQQRKLLLQLEDQLYTHCEDAAFAAFVSGFRVAAGIAIELRGSWYSFGADEEHRAREAFEAERDTI